MKITAYNKHARLLSFRALVVWATTKCTQEAREPTLSCNQVCALGSISRARKCHGAYLGRHTAAGFQTTTANKSANVPRPATPTKYSRVPISPVNTMTTREATKASAAPRTTGTGVAGCFTSALCAESRPTSTITLGNTAKAAKPAPHVAGSRCTVAPGGMMRWPLRSVGTLPSPGGFGFRRRHGSSGGLLVGSALF